MKINRLISRFAGVAAMFVITAAIMMNSIMVNAHTMVYISNADSREIYVLELKDKDGSLAMIEKVAVAGTVMPLAVSPNRKYLYAALRSEPISVSSFAINPNSGKLALLQTVPLADNMAYISTDRSGRYLFGASYSGNKISINAINPNGEVNPKPLDVIMTDKNAHCVATDPSNKFLFVSSLGADLILQYNFNQTTGGIKPNNAPSVAAKKGAGPRHFVFHPNHRFVFSVNELDGTVDTYVLNLSGGLTLLSSISMLPSDFKGKPWAADIHITPDGRFLYASERTSNTIAAFRVNDDSGKLNLIGNYATEAQPRAFNIDPKGKYLLVVGQKSNSLSVYEINRKTGALSKLSHMDVGMSPSWVEIVTLPKGAPTN